MRHSRSSTPSDEMRDEPLAVRLRRVAQEQAQKAIAELERREKERRAAADRNK
jgi:hypothetical protein